MARVSLRIPAGLVGRLRETVLLLYQAAAEALQLVLKGGRMTGRRSTRLTFTASASTSWTIWPGCSGGPRVTPS